MDALGPWSGVAVMMYLSKEAGMGGSLACHILRPSHSRVLAVTGAASELGAASECQLTVTELAESPSGPQTMAGLGAACSTISSPNVRAKDSGTPSSRALSVDAATSAMKGCAGSSLLTPSRLRESYTVTTGQSE